MQGCERIVRPEPRVGEADDPGVALGHDQAFGLEVQLPRDLGVELMGAQGTGDLVLREPPVPEFGQGGRVAVLKRSEVRHQCNSSSSKGSTRPRRPSGRIGGSGQTAATSTSWPSTFTS